MIATIIPAILFLLGAFRSTDAVLCYACVSGSSSIYCDNPLTCEDNWCANVTVTSGGKLLSVTRYCTTYGPPTGKPRCEDKTNICYCRTDFCNSPVSTPTTYAMSSVTDSAKTSEPLHNSPSTPKTSTMLTFKTNISTVTRESTQPSMSTSTSTTSPHQRATFSSLTSPSITSTVLQTSQSTSDVSPLVAKNASTVLSASSSQSSGATSIQLTTSSSLTPQISSVTLTVPQTSQPTSEYSPLVTMSTYTVLSVSSSSQSSVATTLKQLNSSVHVPHTTQLISDPAAFVTQKTSAVLLESSSQSSGATTSQELHSTSSNIVTSQSSTKILIPSSTSTVRLLASKISYMTSSKPRPKTTPRLSTKCYVCNSTNNDCSKPSTCLGKSCYSIAARSPGTQLFILGCAANIQLGCFNDDYYGTPVKRCYCYGDYCNSANLSGLIQKPHSTATILLAILVLGFLIGGVISVAVFLYRKRRSVCCQRRENNEVLRDASALDEELKSKVAITLNDAPVVQNCESSC